MTLSEIENILVELSGRHPNLNEELLTTLLASAGWDNKNIKEAVVIFRQKYQSKEIVKPADKSHVAVKNISVDALPTSRQGEQITQRFETKNNESFIASFFGALFSVFGFSSSEVKPPQTPFKVEQPQQTSQLINNQTNNAPQNKEEVPQKEVAPIIITRLVVAPPIEPQPPKEIEQKTNSLVEEKKVEQVAVDNKEVKKHEVVNTPQVNPKKEDSFFSLVGKFFDDLFSSPTTYSSTPSVATFKPQKTSKEKVLDTGNEIKKRDTKEDGYVLVESKIITQPKEPESLINHIETTKEKRQNKPEEIPPDLPLLPFENSPHVWSFSRYKNVFHGDTTKEKPNLHLAPEVIPEKVIDQQKDNIVVEKQIKKYEPAPDFREDEEVSLEKVPLTKGDEALVFLAGTMLLLVILIMGYMYSNHRF